MRYSYQKAFYYLFYLLWLVALFLTLVDTVIYPGFVYKHTGINLYYVTIVIVFWGLATKLSIFNSCWVKRNNIIDLLINMNLFFTLIFVIVFISLYIVEDTTYPNYVFNKFHIHPLAVIHPLILSIFLFVINVPSGLSAIIRNKTGLYIGSLGSFVKILVQPKIIFSLLVFCIIIINLTKIYDIFNSDLLIMLNKPRATYVEKMGIKVGAEFYNYTEFIKMYTPEDSIILIPPRAYPWPQTGNVAYLRYFLYPRKLLKGNEYSPEYDYIKDNINFVLIAWGETATTQYGYTHGWPKFDVDAEKIMIMEDDGIVEFEGDYKYENYKDKCVWGLIKLK